ncbi:hypothetical protein ACHAQH_009628 [Verticillium albo-atrum]
MWAPELRRIDNVWYMQPSPAATAAALEFCADVTAPTHTTGRDDNFAFSIDGTFLEVSGFGRYYVLSIRDKEFNQVLAITPLNMEKWTVGAWYASSIPD